MFIWCMLVVLKFSSVLCGNVFILSFYRLSENIEIIIWYCWSVIGEIWRFLKNIGVIIEGGRILSWNWYNVSNFMVLF